MTEFAKMDIFFFVTTIAVVLFTILMVILMIYIIKISNDVKYITKRAREEADLISKDLSDLRENLKTKGSRLKHFWSFFNSIREKKK